MPETDHAAAQGGTFDEELLSWRRQLIHNVFRAAVIFGAVAVGFAIFLTRYNWLRPFYLGLYAAFVIVTFTRRGSYTFQAWASVALLYGMGVLALFEDGMGGDGRVFLLTLPLLAFLLLGQRGGLYALGLAILTLAAAGIAFSTSLISIPAEDQVIAADGRSWASGTLVFSVMGAVTVVSLNYLIRQLAAALAQSRQLAQDLETHKASLEEEVAERTQILVDQTKELDQLVAAQQQLLDTIQHISTPVVPLQRGIIVMPLVGVIDSERAHQIVENLLAGIEEHRARVAILDITGVPVVDTGVANSLLQATRAAQLLGTEPILVGLRPEIAQTIVSLGVDLSTLVTRSNLQQGMELALQHVR